MKRFQFALLAAAVLFGPAALAQEAPKRVVLRFAADFTPPPHPAGMALKYFGERLPHRHILAKSAAPARGQERRIHVGIVGSGLARPPVIGDLVVVPLREDWNLGVELPQILVEQIVFVIAAIIGERLRDA